MFGISTNSNYNFTLQPSSLCTREIIKNEKNVKKFATKNFVSMIFIEKLEIQDARKIVCVKYEIFLIRI